MAILRGIDEAISFYISNISSKKSKLTHEQEQNWLRDFKEILKSVKGLPEAETVDQITALHLEAVQTQFLEKKIRGGKTLSNSSVNRIFNCIRHFLQKCEDWSIIELSPARKLKDLPEDLNTRKPWKDHEFMEVYSLAADWFQDVLFFIRYTGVRAGGASSLTWEQVYLDEKILLIKHRKGKDKSLKTYPVPILDPVAGMLKRRRRQNRKFGQGGPKDPVFLNASNKPVSATHMSRETRRLVEKAGLKHLGISLHGLRHSVATSLHKSGASTESIKRILGHSNTKTTERYLHSDPRDLLQAMSQAFKIAE